MAKNKEIFPCINTKRRQSIYLCRLFHIFTDIIYHLLARDRPLTSSLIALARYYLLYSFVIRISCWEQADSTQFPHCPTDMPKEQMTE
ncbi:hypothetical protein [Cloacibacillus porcorum]|uniref:hypothetical protein n=1 Tax=Cloacibacillus porcorum TaxID=1197717 RepID=UPI0012EE2B36